MKLMPLFLFVLLMAVGPADPVAQNVKPDQDSRLKAYPFELRQVRLLEGPFRDAMLRDQKYLLGLEPDRLLHMFRVTAGLPSSAKPYGGWEDPKVELRGHSLGHYLSACALMYASTGDEKLKARADAIVAELARIQQAMPSQGYHAGYLSAFPEEFFDRVDARQKVWAPYYTLHKIMAGLLDVHQLCGNDRALQVLTRLADWVKFRVDRLSDAQQQLALDTEFGGMMEVLENLYGVTGNPEYLRVARKFDHKKVFDPLARGEDPLNGLHANTQIPKAIGAARDYELSGEQRYYNVALFFWQRVAHFRSYVIGGNSDGELFFPPEDFSRHLNANSTETCNTYNMLKLTRHLFQWEPSAETMDFYERGLYNHILASQDPVTGMVTYYVPLKPGAYKTFATPEESFWCCVGTGMENHAKYGDTIYFHNSASLYINLFIASELDWNEKGIVLRQETRFPEEDTTRILFKARQPTRLALRIRYPSWAKTGMDLKINGKKQRVEANPGSYLTVERTWRNGDTVEVRFPMSLQMESLPNNPNQVAILYGPIVLAGDLGTQGLENAKRYGPMMPQVSKATDTEVPALVCDLKDILAKIHMESRPSLAFRTIGIGRPRDMTLVPFYRVFDQRYTVYWTVLSP
ncbi:MAG: beta-L-arabinofuranosidase domain-containing protein [Acidobacteriota bacterium]